MAIPVFHCAIGTFTKDYIGTEVQFPKGNKSSAPLKLDGAIFDDITWFDKYKDYHENGNNESLEWLREHLIVAIEFKKKTTRMLLMFGTNNSKPI